MIKVLVVDDHTLVRAGLARLLDMEHDIEVVGQLSSGHEAIQFCQGDRPDLVLLDYGLPDLDGLETTRQILEIDRSIRILILTMYANEEYAIRLIRAGAGGFLVKAASTEELKTAVRKVAGNGIYVSPPIMEKIMARMGHSDEEVPESALSNREMQVLLRLARGKSTREVAESLSLSLSTIETYRGRILSKLNLRNNSEITRFAIRRELIELD